MTIREGKLPTISSKDLSQCLLFDNKRSLGSLYDMIDNERANSNLITIRPSGVVEFMDHGLAWAVKQILRVSFGNKINTSIGSAVHEGAEFSYKQKMKTGEVPSIRKCLLAVAKASRRYYKWIDKDDRVVKNEFISSYNMYKDAKKLFISYYPLVHFNDPLAVEESVEYSDFVDNQGNPLNVIFKGTFDRIDRHEGALCAVDIKTSAKSASGKTAEGFETEKVRICEIKELQKSLKPRKTIESNVIPEQLISNIDTLKTRIKDVSRSKLKDSPTDGPVLLELNNKIKEFKKVSNLKKVPKVIEQTLEEFQTYQETVPGEIEKLESEIKTLTDSFDIQQELEIDDLEKKLDTIELEKTTITENYHLHRAQKFNELNSEKSYLETKIDAAQYVNDCEKMKEEYGLQIASYAILYELKNKQKIKYGKIERIVRTKDSSYVKTYIFDLNDLKDVLLETLGFILDSIIEWKCNNVPSKVLFNHNPNTFRGQELTKIIKETQLKKNKVAKNVY